MTQANASFSATATLMLAVLPLFVFAGAAFGL